jgi:hypothetical protein
LIAAVLLVIGMSMQAAGWRADVTGMLMAAVVAG